MFKKNSLLISLLFCSFISIHCMELQLPDENTPKLNEEQISLIPKYSIDSTPLNYNQFAVLIKAASEIHENQQQRSYISNQEIKNIVKNNIPFTTEEEFTQLIMGSDYHCQSKITNALVAIAVHNGIMLDSLQQHEHINKLIEKHKELTKAGLHEVTLSDVLNTNDFSELPSFLGLGQHNITLIHNLSLPNLIELYLSLSNIQSIKDFDAPNLKGLWLRNTENLQSLNNCSFPNLTKLDISLSNIQSIKGFDAPKLEQLYLTETKKLQIFKNNTLPNSIKIKLPLYIQEIILKNEQAAPTPDLRKTKE